MQYQIQQPSAIVVQPTAPPGYGFQPVAPQAIPQNSREWSTDLCGCFEDCGSCAYAYFCGPCFMATLASNMDECALGPCCFGHLFLTPMRTKLRTMYGIKGSILSDCCIMAHCGFCAMLQMHRELKHVGHVMK